MIRYHFYLLLFLARILPVPVKAVGMGAVLVYTLGSIVWLTDQFKVVWNPYIVQAANVKAQ